MNLLNRRLLTLGQHLQTIIKPKEQNNPHNNDTRPPQEMLNPNKQTHPPTKEQSRQSRAGRAEAEPGGASRPSAARKGAGRSGSRLLFGRGEPAAGRRGLPGARPTPVNTSTDYEEGA